MNSAAFVAFSLLTFPSPLERLQGAQFVNVFEQTPGTVARSPTVGQAEDLLTMSQRILGASEAQDLFQRAARTQGASGYLPTVTPDFVQALERRLAGSVGAATAHAMVSQVTEGASVSVQDLMAVADEAAQILEYSSRLEAKSDELQRTARALGDANEKLTALSIQKDAFLSQISHELRTPMTSVRAFSEILRDGDLAPEEQLKYANIIHGEAERLTRLLDDLLDLTVLENGQVVINRQQGNLTDLLDRAVSAAIGQGPGLRIIRNRENEDLALETDLDRLVQVFVNLIGNARKYCDAPDPELRIELGRAGGERVLDFIDNGTGIPVDSQQMIFEKFSRLGDQARAGGAGLGLAICHEVMERLGGRIAYLPGQGGAAFRVWLPADQAMAAQ